METRTKNMDLIFIMITFKKSGKSKFDLPPSDNSQVLFIIV